LSEHDAPNPPQLIRRLLANLFGLARNHLALFSIELEEERERLLWLLALSVLALVLVALGLVLLSIALVWWVDPAWRTCALAGLGAAYLLLALLCGWLVRHKLVNGPAPFAGTLAELRKDREQLLP
jgi:uncharacterized membrane protein YqjE